MNSKMDVIRRKFKANLKFFLSLSLCLVMSAYAFASDNGATGLGEGSQDSGKTVTGTITDTAGEPLIGVTIIVEGTTQGVITDVNGQYSVQVPSEESVLVYSFIGYLTERMPVAGKTDISITLTEDMQDLGEVVVTALGMKKQDKALGYAMTEIKGDDLDASSVNPVNALQGKAAGVDISQSDGGMFGSSKIEIRGVSSLSGNNQPIYVVDGVILDNSEADSGDADWSSDTDDWGNELKNLNPADFATVSILKGAAATALYGSRGLNGAVVITTKSGKSQKGLGVSFSQSIGVDYVYKQPDLQNEFGAGYPAAYIDYGELDSDNNYYAWDTNQFYLNSDGERQFNNMNYSYGPAFDGSDILGYDNEWTKYVAQDHNYRDIYNLGFNTTSNLAIQGGNETTTFYTSLSYKHAKGNLGKNEFNRLTFLAKASHKLTEKIKMEASMNFAVSTPKNPLPNIGEYFALGTFNREYDPDYYKNKYKGSHGGMASSDYGDKYGDVPGVKLWWKLNENSSVQRETSVRPYVALTIDLTDWLKLKGEANYNYYFTDLQVENPNYGYARTYSGGAGEYSVTQTTKKQANADVNLMFNKNLNPDLNLSGFVRAEYYDNVETYLNESTSDGLAVPDQYFIGNSVSTVDYDAEIQGEKRMYSAAAQASLAWKNKIYLDVTGRNDWSSALVYSDGTGTSSYFYPSVSLSGIVSDMVQLPSWITFGKVRASWAQVGSDTDPYSINTAYDLQSLVEGDEDGTNNVKSLKVADSMIDSNLKPQRKNSFEFGLDWRFLNSRIGIDASYYKDNIHNQIMDVDVPEQSGVSSMTINAGNIQNSGIEIGLNTTPFKRGDWQWDLDFTYTKNKNKIISLDSRVADYILLDGYTNYGNFRVGSVAKVGGSYGMLMTDSKALTDDGSGLPILTYDSTDQGAYMQRSGEEEVVGSIMPDFLGSVATTLRYKNWSLHIGTDMRFGGYVASYGAKYASSYGFSTASLKNRSSKHGGITWTSAADGVTYHDGMIPNGIFEEGTEITSPSGSTYTVADGGETYKQLYEAGVLEPTHASYWNYNKSSWGSGVINDDWIKELNYIAIREISINYNANQLAKKLGLQSLGFNLSGRNLGYLLNTAPGGVNPESVRGTSASNFRMRSYSAYTANYMFTISTKF